jgi:hypothetical protein
MIDKNYEYVVMRNSALFGLHDTKLLRAQTYPGLSQELVDKRDIDLTLHQALLGLWAYWPTFRRSLPRSSAAFFCTSRSIFRSNQIYLPRSLPVLAPWPSHIPMGPYGK